jgi:chromosome segregation ATPase
MSAKIDELFATLRGLVEDQTRDLALAMGELRSVAAERDRLFNQQEKYASALHWASVAVTKADEVRDKLKAELDNARQSLRAAEADAAETDSVNSDLRTVNARLVADLAAAMERLDHAESIIMQ